MFWLSWELKFILLSGSGNCTREQKSFYPRFGYRQIKVFYGDGYKGVPAFAPYDGILITAAAPEIPQKLVEQLNPGGVIVIPLGEGDVQTMIRLTKKEDGSLNEEHFGGFRFVPLLKRQVE